MRQLPLADLLCQSIDNRMTRFEDVNAAECLSQYLTLRHVAALTSRLPSFETKLPKRNGNPARPAAINRSLLAKPEIIDPPRQVSPAITGRVF